MKRTDLDKARDLITIPIYDQRGEYDFTSSKIFPCMVVEQPTPDVVRVIMFDKDEEFNGTYVIDICEAATIVDAVNRIIVNKNYEHPEERGEKEIPFE